MRVGELRAGELYQMLRLGEAAGAVEAAGEILDDSVDDETWKSLEEEEAEEEENEEEELPPPPTRDESRAPLSVLRQWDDDFVLKRTFSALIPAFDPRYTPLPFPYLSVDM